MDKASRHELLRIVEAQREKITKYEAKLKDLVVAYKGLAKEKEALDASLKILSQKKTESDSPSSEHKQEGEHQSTTDKKENQFTDPLQATHKGDGKEEEKSEAGSSESDQIKTLTESLLTLTQEKSKLESVYLADKKRLLQENEDLNEKINEEKEKSENDKKKLEKQIQELKLRIREQQTEREKEQNDHALMLRELQKLLAQERTSKDQLENQVDDLKFTLSEKSQLLPSMSQAYEKKITDLTAELKEVRGKLEAEKIKAEMPPEGLIQLQNDMSKMKKEYQLQLLEEQKRSSESQAKLERYRQESENRVSALESKISELSDLVGNYERYKVQDQQTIQKLKDRMSQLDLENTALSRSASQIGNYDEEWRNLEASQLGDLIVKLQGFLREANKRTATPVLLEDLLRDEDGQCPKCRKNREEWENLKEEYERYKLRAQSVLKNKTSKDTGNSKEMDTLKSQLNELRERNKSLHIQHEAELGKEKAKLETAHKTLVSVQEKHKAEILHLEAEYQHQKSELEVEIRKQRERTVSLLAEKDRDIEMLKASMPIYDERYFLQNPPDSGASAEFPGGKSEEERAVSRLLNMSSLNQGDSNLFYRQELSRKEVEINALRKQKHELESALRELQLNSHSKEESLTERIEMLTEEIRRNDRSKAREGANLEYLKNVTYKFLTSFDPKAKQQMLNAITTILQFSPQEKSVVHTQLKSWWAGTIS
ncbi:GRIP and coiled-coil domain-containing protein 1-like [Saccostrea echinata]|uniref:GRIP and coiled-coil domain-containing protein 1-like n=1 Tax=Saccostrea echinata TaxID=191078 RepID=UPI002A80B0F2|nr:GRIP and coiled-coil domain-containing protein 1-like [Saccostrea echinata]